MVAAATVAVLVCVLLAIVRAARGPTVFDRLQAVNTIGTCAVLAIALFGFLDERPAFLDLAITYALLNVIGIVAVLKFFRHGDLGAADAPGKDDEQTV
ncbi:MAG: monovalent cation/H+ antiporter complex subunit F [Steroidobacteraceae bacterium]|nr:monovalent cation/H+ antiporter complex subunit F [Steroidobacteraceae bacterium]MDW8260283.1 monovalent cation/H+ antiporter complex subunit F [Gammaproteobacteria bacterium]